MLTLNTILCVFKLSLYRKTDIVCVRVVQIQIIIHIVNDNLKSRPMVDNNLNYVVRFLNDYCFFFLNKIKQFYMQLVINSVLIQIKKICITIQ